MRPEIKFGLIGGVIFTLVVVTGTYLIEFSVKTNTTVTYLRLLVFLVSIVAGIKGIRDLNRREPLELKKGLRAGLTTTMIICGLYFVFCFINTRFTPEEKFTANNELFWQAFMERYPVKDTSQVQFDRMMMRYDSAMKEGEIMIANMSLRRAKMIHPGDNSLDEKISSANHQVYLRTQEFGPVLRSILFQNILPLMVMGFFVSFITVMIFRYKQQADQ